MSEGLWTIHDVAQYLRCSVLLARKKFINCSGFPASIVIRRSDGRDHLPLWKPSEVAQWAEAQRKEQP